MDWFISALMILWYWLAGNKWKYTWHLSVFVNLVWIVYAITIGEYGLIPSSAIIGGIAVRNLILWKGGKNV